MKKTHKKQAKSMEIVHVDFYVIPKLIIEKTKQLRYLTKKTPLDLKLKKHWALAVNQTNKRSAVTIDLPKNLYVQCDKCTGLKSS